MTIKVLFLNFQPEVDSSPKNVILTKKTIEDVPVLHDFHAIVMDTEDVLDEVWWTTKQGIRTRIRFSETNSTYELRNYSKKIQEHVETGGIVFCFSGSEMDESFKTFDSEYSFSLENYFFCPIKLEVINECGDTFYLKHEELKYLSPLFKEISPNEITWKCYFSEFPEDARVIGTNRAGYSVFMEVPLGAGKFILLPRFKNRAEAVKKIVYDIIPQMFPEEERISTPKWLPEFSSSYEEHIQDSLQQIDKAKRLLFTNDKALEKAVAFAFEKMGFEVKELPKGTNADLQIIDDGKSRLVEVKGHEKRQAQRNEVLQVLGYLSETDTEEKGIVVCNHEFNKHPTKRSEKAFTEGAIKNALKIDVVLLSSITLYEVVMKILEKKLDDEAIRQFRNKIMSGSGLVNFE